MNQSDPLSQLKAIHLPAPVSWWPLAPGWYVVLLILLVAAVVIVFFFIRWWKAYQFRQQALRKLYQLKRQHQDDPRQQQTISQLNKLLKHVAMNAFPLASVSSLYGTSWLKFLDQTGNTKAFTTGTGQKLIDAPYQRQQHDDASQLFVVAENWIRGLR